MTTPTLRDFTMHGSSGHSVLRSKWLDWVAAHQGLEGSDRENGFGFGHMTHYSWYVGDEKIEMPFVQWDYWCELPDASGFIIFQSKRNTDNCVLRDAYGKDRMRLTVPLQLTGLDIPKDVEMWFKNISDPYKNPKDGQVGIFGVTAWVEGSGSGGYLEGDWYFEFDYHTGTFLWGREIRS